MNMKQIVEQLGGELKRPCPDCKTGVLELVEATIVEQHVAGYHNAAHRVPERERACLAAACNACEFITEVRL